MEVEIHRIGVPFKGVPLTIIGSLRSGLSVRSMGFGGKLTTRIAYHTHKNLIYGARKKTLELLIKKVGITKIINLIPMGENIDCKRPNLVLNNLQEKIVAHIFATNYSPISITNGTSTFYLDLLPGKGKTFIAAAIIQKFAKKTIYIVPSVQLQKETILVLNNIFPDLQIGEYSGLVKTDGDIVVMTVDSATGSDEFFLQKLKVGWDDYFKRFGVCILDEVHDYCTKVRSAVFYRCGAAIQLALSGTSNDRQDKMDGLSHYWFGKPFNAVEWYESQKTEEEKQRVNEDEWKVKLVCMRYNGPPKYTQPCTSIQGTNSAPKMITQISKDPYRSQLLIDLAVELVAESPDNNIFIFADRTVLVSLVHEYLSTQLPESQISIVIGDVKTKNARKGRIVLGTFACIGTGISWSEFNCIIYWHPRRNKHKQFLNRIFRESSDRKINRKIYFLQDNATAIKGQYSGLSAIWKKMFPTKPPIIDVINYKEIEVSIEVKKIAEKFSLQNHSKDEVDESSEDSED